MPEIFFDSHTEARKFAQDLLLNDITVSKVSINKKRYSPLWSVHYSVMCKDFMEKYSIKEGR